MDLVFRVDEVPRHGETRTGESFKTFPGGKGANQAVAIAKLGTSVAFVGQVGDDAFGDQVAGAIREAGVDVTGLRHMPGQATGVGCILVERSGQNRIVLVPGANMTIPVEGLVEQLDGYGPPQVLVSQLEVPLDVVEASLRWARQQGAITILDPAPAQELHPATLSLVDYLLPNQVEVEQLTSLWAYEESTCLEAARRLIAKGVGNVVITMAERGSFWASGDGHRMFAARPVESVDTTAAGDAFCGALAACLAQGMSTEAAIEFANAAGAFSTTRPGAIPSMPSRAELEAFIRSA